jgi:hypothetical protein
MDCVFLDMLVLDMSYVASSSAFRKDNQLGRTEDKKFRFLSAQPQHSSDEDQLLVAPHS